MHKNTLREIAKFGSGLVAADFLVGLWLYTGGYLPINFLGVEYGDRAVVAGMIFDIILFAWLVHYGWRMQERRRSSGEKLFHRIAGTVFAIVALLHFFRIIYGLNFSIGSWQVPFWVNGIGVVVTAFLAYASFDLAKKS